MKEVNEYLHDFKLEVDQDKELREILFANEFAEPEVFWRLVEQQATTNFIKTGDPTLTPHQFIEIYKDMLFTVIKTAMKDLKARGLVEGDDESGYVLTPTGKEIASQLCELKNFIENHKS